MGLKKMNFVFATETFALGASSPSCRQIFRQLIHFTATTQDGYSKLKILTAGW
jgi:superfamily II RNA helicase